MTPHYLGVDLGSTTAKAVVVDNTGTMRSSAVVQMGAVSRAGMERAVAQALDGAGITADDAACTVSTGYGRRLVPGAERAYTEITCHARGAAAMAPGVRLVVDIGGQDSKAIVVGDDGLVVDFAMNDRCAGGTGRFYEVLARALEVDLDGLADLALAGTEDLSVSSMCATFAETEIISLLAQGLPTPDIAASVHRTVAARTLALVAQVGKRSPVVLTGGVARNRAAVHHLERVLDLAVVVPAQPQITGAYGAALLALELDAGTTAPSHGAGLPAAVADADPEIAALAHATVHRHSAGVTSCAACSASDRAAAVPGVVHLGAVVPHRRDGH